MTTSSDGLPRLSWAEACARRLDRHTLAAPSQDARPARIVGTICGAHAQVMSAAELSIGLRIAGITRGEIHEALWTERSLVKTFGPRGTVHLLAAQDLPEWIGALSAIPPSSRGHKQDVRLTPEQTDAVVAAIDAALADAELSIDELSEAVIADAGSWAGELVMSAFQGMWPRWRQAMATAARRDRVPCHRRSRAPGCHGSASTPCAVAHRLPSLCRLHALSALMSRCDTEDHRLPVGLLSTG